MLAIYDINHIKVGALVNYSNYYIERAKGSLDILYFTINNAAPEYKLLKKEGYIRTEKYGEYIIKEMNSNDGDATTTTIVGDQNVEPLKGSRVDTFEAVEQTAIASANLALVGTGWSVRSSNVTKLRTVRQEKVMAFDILKEIQSIFGCEMVFDTILKQIDIIQERGQDKGVYFAEQLNLKALSTQGSTRSLVTCLVPLGKDGLTIADVNGGVDYISNHQYTNKDIFAYWEDNRYTVAQDLYDDAVARLNYLSKPCEAYSAQVIDLANASGGSYSLLDYDYGDTIMLLAQSKDIKVKQRIVKVTIFPDEPQSNTCEIANRITSLEDLNVRFFETSNVVDKVTTQNGMVDGSKVELFIDDGGSMVSQLLTATIAAIGTLIATKASVTELDAAFADVMLLVADKANITDLTAINADIGNLSAINASIVNLLTDNAGIGSLTSELIMANYAAIKNGNIGHAMIGNAQIIKGKIADAAVTNANIDRASVDKLVVTESDIANAAITNAKIDRASVDKLVVGTADIALGAIKVGLIDKEVVDTAQIKDLAVTDAKILELTASKITSGELSTERLIIRDPINPTKSLIYSINTISGALQSIQGDTINGEIVTNNSITSQKLVADSVTAREIAAHSVSTNELAVGAITADSGIIANAAILTAMIGDGQITNAKIADLTADIVKAGVLSGVYGHVRFLLDEDRLFIGQHELKLEDTGALSFTSSINADVKDYMFTKSTTDKCDAEIDGTFHTTQAFSWGACVAERRNDFGNEGIDFVF